MGWSVRVRRLLAATLGATTLVLAVSILVGSGRAQSSDRLTHTCSAADKQFLDTARSNLVQLGYWSDSLLSGDVAGGVVIKQARSEAGQVAATRPTDPTLSQTRNVLRQMFSEYARAVSARLRGGDPGVAMALSYTLANQAHDLLVQAQPDLAARGCDVTQLFQTA